MPGGFTFGATMRGFFIATAAFFGCMVVAGDGGGKGERRRGRGGQGEGGEVAAREGALGVNRRGAAGNWGVGGEIGGIWEKPARTRRCHYQGAPGVGLVLSRCAGAPDINLPRRDRHGSACSFIGLVPAQARFGDRRCRPFFGPKPKFRASYVLRDVLGPVIKTASELALAEFERVLTDLCIQPSRLP
jgi:hypothetical protein